MTNVIVEKVTKWLWQIALKKGVSYAVKALISFIGGVKMASILNQLGLTVDLTILAGGLATLIGSGLAFIQNWVKIKFGVTWL